MSREIQIGFPCPHYIVEESVKLDSDRRTVITGSPIASELSVRIMINNSLNIPSTGLKSQAFLTSSSEGPYKIEKCVGLLGPNSNILILETPDGRWEIPLPISKRISLEELKKKLVLTEIFDYIEVTDQDGAIAFKEKMHLGKDSWIKVSGKGAEALGFVQKGARGMELFPPWALYKEESQLPLALNPRSASTKKLMFARPLKGNPQIKLSYVTLPSLCKRCRATFVENDYRFNPLGELLTITDENLLFQACLKMILTERSSNPYHPAYGSNIMKRIGKKAVNAPLAQVKEDVQRALRTVISLQRQQREFQTVTSKELLSRIGNLEVRIDPNDPTTYFVDVIVYNASNQPVSISVTYTAPGAVALAGSNGAGLGTNKAGL